MQTFQRITLKEQRANTLAHLLLLPDSDVVAMLQMVSNDLEKAANENPHSEWHNSCFSAAFILAKEVVRRNLAKAEQLRSLAI